MGTGAIPLRSHDLLSSRLYGRLRSFTESCLAARGLYHRWGISPRPEDPDSINESIAHLEGVVKRWKKNLGGVLAGTVGLWYNETQRNGEGTAPEQTVDAIVCVVDAWKRDSEMKILIGCTQQEKALIEEFHNKSQYMKGILIPRERT